MPKQGGKVKTGVSPDELPTSDATTPHHAIKPATTRKHQQDTHSHLHMHMQTLRRREAEEEAQGAEEHRTEQRAPKAQGAAIWGLCRQHPR